MKKPDLNVLNLGWGVQSFTMSAMVAMGILKPVDIAIHANTTHEYTATVEFAKRWTPWLEAKGVKVVTVCGVNTDIVKNKREIPIPAFTLSETGKGGQLRRQCTDHWKIRPIRKYIRRLLGNGRNIKVEMWLGISLDEVERMRHSDVKWINNKYPLIDLNMSRSECIYFLKKNGLEIPPKSSCVFCPYQNKERWRDLKHKYHSDYQRAIAADELIRDTRPPFPLFVHPSRRPLKELDLRIQIDFGQMDFFSEECQGVCFL